MYKYILIQSKIAILHQQTFRRLCQWSIPVVHKSIPFNWLNSPLLSFNNW